MSVLLETAAFLGAVYGAGKLVAAQELSRTKYLPLSRAQMPKGATSKIWERDFSPLEYTTGGAGHVHLGGRRDGRDFDADVLPWTQKDVFDVRTELLFAKKPEVGAPNMQRAWFFKHRADVARRFGEYDRASDLERMSTRLVGPDARPVQAMEHRRKMEATKSCCGQ